MIDPTLQALHYLNSLNQMCENHLKVYQKNIQKNRFATSLRSKQKKKLIIESVSFQNKLNKKRGPEAPFKILKKNRTIVRLHAFANQI